MNRNKYEAFIENLRSKVGEGKIKVGIDVEAMTEEEDAQRPNREWLWATPIGKRYAKIDNIPFFTCEIGHEDVVEVIQAPEEAGSVFYRFVRVISRGSYTGTLCYNPGSGLKQCRKRYDAIIKHLRADNDIATEGMVPGVCSFSVPTGRNFSDTVKTLDATPHLISHSFTGLDESYFDVDIDSIPEE